MHVARLLSFVFPALERFITRLQTTANLVAQRAKFAAYSRDFDLRGYEPLERLGGFVSSFTGPIEPGGQPLVGHGLLVGGIPLGDDTYVAQELHIVTTRIESYIHTTGEQLRDESQDAWSLGLYCLSPDFDHWLRHVPPAMTSPFAARVDSALMCYLGELVRQPPSGWREIVLRRIRQPARRHGMGMRSRFTLAPCGFSACFVECAEAMVDGGDLGPLFPTLIGTFGAGAFVDGGSRFDRFLQSGLPTTGAFAVAWAGMRAEVAGVGVRGPLDMVAASAGSGGVRHLQRQITEQRELVSSRALTLTCWLCMPAIRCGRLGCQRIASALSLSQRSPRSVVLVLMLSFGR